MKQELDEEGIRRLFREQREADESLAPHFSATLEAALSRRRKYSSGRLIFQVAFATVALVALIGAVIGVVRFFPIRSANEQPGIAAQDSSQPDMSSPRKPPIIDMGPMLGVGRRSPKPPQLVSARPRAHRHTPARAITLISQWRSPTDFLLRTPGDELLKTVPRLGTSAIEIKMNFPDGKN
jgi:hypothetical protein